MALTEVSASSQNATALPPAKRPSTRKTPARTKRERLAKLDRRTKLARFVREMRADLVRHVGGSPSATETVAIDMAIDTALEIEAMKQRRADNGSLSLHDHRAFLAYVNTLRRTLSQLGMKAAPKPAPSIHDIVWDRPNEAAA